MDLVFSKSAERGFLALFLGFLPFLGWGGQKTSIFGHFWGFLGHFWGIFRVKRSPGPLRGGKNRPFLGVFRAKTAFFRVFVVKTAILGGF